MTTPATIAESPPWSDVRPRWERMLHAIGVEATAALCGIDRATVYRRARGDHGKRGPHQATVTLVHLAVSRWEASRG